jgi:hypothetical protein
MLGSYATYAVHYDVYTACLFCLRRLAIVIMLAGYAGYLSCLYWFPLLANPFGYERYAGWQCRICKLNSLPMLGSHTGYVPWQYWLCWLVMMAKLAVFPLLAILAV